MHILVVCSGNAPDFNLQKNQAFIYDQVKAIEQLDETLIIDYFFVKGKGVLGYLSCLKSLKKRLFSRHYDVIHAHVVMSGMLANLQRRVPVVTTFHGSDINLPLSRLLSVFVGLLSSKSIYISEQLALKAILPLKSKQFVIPCGVDFDLFFPQSKQACRERLGLLSNKIYILFSSGFDIAVKNYALAREAINLLQDEKIELLELKNYTRQEVALLFNAVDLALMTSFSEGSPQFVKEALACNCPVVSTDVGDVKSVIGSIAGCYITTFEPEDVAGKINNSLKNRGSIRGRDRIQQFDNRLIAQRVREVYYQLI